MAVKRFALKTCATLVVVVAIGPWPAAQAAPATSEAEMTCTGAAQATFSPGLNATAQDFDITVEDSVLECDDNRPGADTRIIGARVSDVEASHGKGSCGAFTATIEVRVDWITADGANPQQSTAKATVDVDLTVDPMKLVVTREITDGLFAGYEIAAGTPVMALDAFAAACESSEGLTQVVGRHSISLSP
jgi:hypothetical protein